MTTPFKSMVSDALRYWEPRRIVYNGALALIVMAYFAVGLPESKELLSLNVILMGFLLAVLANICYCAAYLPDLLAQASQFRPLWLKIRWVLFAIGMVFAGIITRWIAMGLFFPNGFTS